MRCAPRGTTHKREEEDTQNVSDPSSQLYYSARRIMPTRKRDPPTKQNTNQYISTTYTHIYTQYQSSDVARRAVDVQGASVGRGGPSDGSAWVSPSEFHRHVQPLHHYSLVGYYHWPTERHGTIFVFSHPSHLRSHKQNSRRRHISKRRYVLSPSLTHLGVYSSS